MILIYLPEAEEELTEAAEFSAHRALSPSAADALLQDARAAEALILEFPHASPPLRGGFRRCLLRKHDYQLIYRVEGDLVRVYAFAHQKRRPGYWRKRIEKATGK